MSVKLIIKSFRLEVGLTREKLSSDISTDYRQIVNHLLVEC